MIDEFKNIFLLILLLLTFLFPASNLNAETVPLPPQNPLREKSSASKKKADPEQWSEKDLIKAHKKCSTLLANVSLEFIPVPPIRKGQCGTPAPLKVTSIGTNGTRVKLAPHAIVNCPLAAALNRWLHKVVQPTAGKILKDRVTDLRIVAHYTCRRRYGNPKKRMSEHAFANAVDIAAIKLENKQWLSVLEGWGPTEKDIQIQITVLQKKAEKERLAKAEAATVKAETLKNNSSTDDKDPIEANKKKTSTKNNNGPAKNASSDKTSKNKKTQKARSGSNKPGGKITFERPKLDEKARFLRSIHKQACGLFGTVLGPEANDAHKDHFHLDLAPRKRSAFCE